MHTKFPLLYKITYKLSTTYPKGNICSLIQMFINSLGAILLSSSLSKNDKKSFVVEFLKKITLLNCTDSFAHYYNLICIIGFSLMLFFISVIILGVLGMKHSFNESFHKVAGIILSICSKIIYLLNVLCSFFLEFYIIGLVNVCVTKDSIGAQHHYILRINDGKIQFKIFIAILNCFSMIFLILLFSFSRILFREYKNEHLNILNRGTVTIESIYLFYQALFSVSEIIFNHNLNSNVKFYFVFTFILILLVIFDEFMLQWNLYLRKTSNVLFRKFLNYYFLISGIIEMGLRVIFTEDEGKFMQTHMMNFKFFCKFILSLLTVYFLYMYKYSYYQNQIKKILFQDIKGKDVDTLFYFLEMIIGETEVNQNDIVDIILEHKHTCKKSKTCSCKLFTEECFKGKKLKHMLTILGENELTLKINYLHSENISKYLDDIILIHILFVLYLRRNKMLAFYLCTAYSYKRKQKGSFYLLYVLYKIRLDIIKEIDLNIKGVYANEAFVHRGVCQIDLKGISPTINLNDKQKIFHPALQAKYILFSEKILKLIYIIISTIEEFIKFKQHDIYQYKRSSGNGKINKQNEKKFTSETFFDLLHKVRTTRHEIAYQMKKYYKTFTQSIKFSQYLFYPEFQFLLYYYYSLIQVIPNPIEKLNINEFKIKTDLIFEGIDVTNPMILVFDLKEDIYKIAYINYITINKLKETRESLIGKPFNNLIPYYLSKNHDLLMKIYTMNKNDLHYYSNKTFLVDKFQFLHHVNIKFSTIPTMKDVFTLIVDIQFEEIKESDPTTIYYLILSSDNTIRSMTNSFIKNFFFTRKMLMNLKLTAQTIFGIDFACQYFGGNKMNLTELNNSLTVFGKVDNINTRHEKSIEIITEKKFVYYEESITQEQFMKLIYKIEQHAVELNVDFEYLFKLNCLKQRIISNDKLNETDNKDVLFRLKYSHRSLGDVEYIIVQIEENASVGAIENNIKNLRSKLDNYINFTDEDDLGRTLKEQSIQPQILNKFQFTSKESGAIEYMAQQFNENNSNLNTEDTHLNTLNAKKETTLQSPIPSTSSTLMLQNNTSGIMINNSTTNQSNSSVLLVPGYFKTSPRHTKQQISNKTPSDSFSKNKIESNNFLHLEHSLRKITKDALNIKSIFLLSHCVFCFIVIMLLIGLFALNLYNIVFNSATLNNSQTISEINFNAILLKGDIIDLGIYYIVLCLLTDGLTPKSTIVSEDNYRQITNFRTNKILEHLQDLNIRSNKMNNVKGMDKVFASLSYEDTYLTRSFEGFLVERKATFCEEVRQLYYYAVSITHHEKLNYCNLIAYLQSNEVNETQADFTEITEITSEERLLFYFLNNILSKLKYSCLNLSMETNSILVDYHNTAKKNFLLTNILILILIFLLYSLIVVSLIKDKTQISSFIITFLQQSHEQETILTKIAKRLAIYKQCINDFSYKNIKLFICSLRDGPDFQVMKKRSKTFGMNWRTTNCINRKEKDKQIEKRKEIQKERNLYLINNSHLFTPIFLKYSLAAMIIMFICLAVFQICIIIYMNFSYNTLMFINQMAVNYIERIPIILELLYYYMNSILLDDPYFQPTPQKDGYTIHLTSNYYNISYDLSEDTFFKILGDSGYGYLYYSFLVNRENLQIFMNDKSKSKSLSRTVKFSKLIDSHDENFPLNVALYYNLFYGEECTKKGNNFSIEKCFKDISDSASLYLGVNREMHYESAIILINSMIDDMNHLYSEYISHQNKVERLDYLINSNFLITLDNMRGIFYNMHLIYIRLLYDDIQRNYDFYKTVEIVLSLLSILSNFVLFTVTSLYVINKIRIYISLLKYEGKKVYGIITQKNLIKEEDNVLFHSSDNDDNNND